MDNLLRSKSEGMIINQHTVVLTHMQLHIFVSQSGARCYILVPTSTFYKNLWSSGSSLKNSQTSGVLPLGTLPSL